MAQASPYTYNISSNGAAGDWYWEVTSRGEIIARGLAATEALARAEALRTARPGADRHALDHKPPGILDCSRQLAASRSSPPNGHPAPPSVGMLDFRWTRGAVEIE